MNTNQRRKILEKASVALKSAEKADELYAQKRRNARVEIDQFLERKTRSYLTETSLEDLKSHPVRDIRWKAFFDNGFRNAAEIADLSFSELTSCSGIGEKSARQVFGLISSLSESYRKSVSSNEILAEGKILDNLAEFLKVKHAKSRCKTDVLLVTARLSQLHNQGRPARSGWTLLFRSSRVKQAAFQAIDELKQFTSSKEFDDFQVDVAEVQSAGRASYKGGFGQNIYEQNPTDFVVLLEDLRGPGVNQAGIQGGLSQQIVAAVENLELSTTGLQNISLRGYQNFGAKYAVVQKKALLGDEMGLGKTIQSLAFIAHLKNREEQTHFMIVCPASVLANWENEIDRFTRFPSLRLHGNEREENLRAWVNDGGIALTTFDTFRILNSDTDFEVPVLIVDEAHFLKNRESQRSISLHEVTRNAEYALYLTGTPMENRLSEFIILAKVLNNDLLFFDGPKFSGTTAEFKRRVAPVYLRRNQEEVLSELPEKVEYFHFLDQSEEEAEHYRSIQPRFPENLRQAASVTEHRSNKLEKIRELVAEAESNGRKVLIFSRYRDSLRVISNELDCKVFGPITGDDAISQRQEIVEAFSISKDFAVLIANIDTVAVGMNIQAASVVILVEPQWKPSTQDQAVARAHRMGQRQVVLVHRLFYKNTIDLRLMATLDMKVKEFNQFVPVSLIRDLSVDSTFTGSPEDLEQFIEESRNMSQAQMIEAEQATQS